MSLRSHCIPLLVVILMMPWASLCQLDLIRSLFGLTYVQGTLYCTIDDNIIPGLFTPTFPNAGVEMRCGAGTVVSSAKTDAMGKFSMLLDAPRVLLSFLLTNCSLVAVTPLVDCNTALPSFGSLASPLQLIGNTFLGIFNVTNITPQGFRFRPIV